MIWQGHPQFRSRDRLVMVMTGSGRSPLVAGFKVPLQLRGAVVHTDGRDDPASRRYALHHMSLLKQCRSVTSCRATLRGIGNTVGG